MNTRRTVNDESEAATAYEYWDGQWAHDEGCAPWRTPEAFVAEAVALLRERGVEGTLDLGCGAGRHALYLASEGFASAATDASAQAIRAITEEAERLGVGVDARVSSMTEQPFRDAAFGGVVAWNVIYHGDRRIVARTFSEVARLLRPGGLFIGNMLSTRSPRFGEGREIAPGTWVDVDGEGDLAHPHHYCEETDLVWLLSPMFHLWLLEHEPPRTGSRSAHWNFIVERKAG
jgi:SAM-dependent methyltransferase